MKQAYIINGVRTAIGNFGGTLSTIRTDDLAAHVLKSLKEKNSQINFWQSKNISFGSDIYWSR